ncbi:MAG: SDR family oxidoreductase, partial [Gammaproteobacteria bacterium]|nr:SDR family oxidoreductase [Gammaproteobacteria bacterium]
MQNNLEGKNIVIIGGTAGIGLATAIAASEMGANVWAAGRSEAHIEKAKAASNGKFEVRQADTHEANQLHDVFKEAGTIDHLVSAAIGGERTLKPFVEQTEEQFKAAYGKLWGYAKVVREGHSYVPEDGAITLVSGSPARKIAPSMSALSCVGGAVENMVRCLAVELAPIRVNVVSPGTISTAMFDHFGDEKEERLNAATQGHLIKRAGTAEEVAEGMIFAMNNSLVPATTFD